MTKSEKGLSKRVPRVIVQRRLGRYFELLCRAVDTPRSLAAWILFREGEYSQLVTLEINPLWYQSAYQFRSDYLITKVLSKYPGFKHPDLRPDEAALTSFLEFERACKVTNAVFNSISENRRGFAASHSAMHSILQSAREKIRVVLGSVNLERLDSLFKWGPGATSVSRGSYTSAYIKFAQRLDVTHHALAMGWAVVNSRPAWVNCQLITDQFPSVPATVLPSAFTLQRGNEIVFVPKTAKTKRTIAKEPHLNTYVQAGAGRYIRQRLLSIAGIDLNDQSINQRLAREGAITGLLATIDLKGASDTISRELVRYLLPSRWYSLLNAMRSHQGLTAKGWIHYEKFSSMGNASTFELESLIFWALCSATLQHYSFEGDLSVYGDDLIVPSASYHAIRKVLLFCGFKLNESKSFADGPFRESCGEDYFFGTSVKPFYLREELCNVESLYRLANRVREFAHRDNLGYCDARFRGLWKAIVNDIPPSLRYFVPYGYGDVGVVGNFDEATPTRARNGWDGYYFNAVIRSPHRVRMQDGHAGYTAMLFGNDREEREDLHWLPVEYRESYKRLTANDRRPANGTHSLRDRTRPRVARLRTRGWYELGPWS